MVTIIDFKKRTNTEGEEFIALVVEGGIEIVTAQSGKMYATARKCSIPSTFDENSCKAIIGQEIPGNIQTVPCEPYEYTVESTGEIVTLEHRWQYTKEPEENVIFHGEVQQPNTAAAPKPVFQ